MSTYETDHEKPTVVETATGTELECECHLLPADSPLPCFACFLRAGRDEADDDRPIIMSDGGLDVIEAAQAATEKADRRDVRAATESMVTVNEAPGLFRVYSGTDSAYVVDAFDGACECPDFQYREIKCKHIRRAEMAMGVRPIPAGVDVDPVLRQRLDGGGGR